MPDPDTVLFIDLVDPGSFIMLERVRQVAAAGGFDLAVAPFEIRPAPEPVIDARDPAWVAYWHQTLPALAGLGLAPAPPTRIPRTRKAHELVMHAREAGCSRDVVGELMRAFLEHGADLGRVDVLVEQARGWGLDATHAKATLDVDRHTDDVIGVRTTALARGVTGVPTLARGDALLGGIHDPGAIAAFLRGD